MFEGIKAKCLDIGKRDYQELKTWEWNEEFRVIVKCIFQTDVYRSLSLEYKNRVYQVLNQLQEMDLNYFDLEEALKTFERFFRNWAITTSENFYYYLDVLLDYPTFPIMDAYLFAEYPDENDQKLLNYTRIEAKLYSLEEDFSYYTKEFENIVKNKKLRELGLTDVMVNGIINTHLPKDELVCHISNLLEKDYSWLILKLFQAPTMKHIEIVLKLINDQEVTESSHVDEMVDMIYKIPLDELREMEFKLTYKFLGYQEMSFDEASRNYHVEAMEILDEATKPIRSYTRVRVPVYQKRH